MTAGIVFQLLAGLLHLVLTPEHMLEALGIGVFFLLVGSAQVAWALVRLRHAGRILDDIGVLLAASTLVVYVLSRSFADPFTGNHEDIDLFGIYTQALQVGAIAFLLAPAGVRRSWPYTLALLAGGILLGAALYGAGLAAAELFPGLGETHQHTH